MVTIGSIKLDNNTPKICVPIVGESLNEIIQECRYIQDKPHDLLEIRMDFFKDAADNAAVTSLLQAMRQEIGHTPLLFTFRTKAEGGEAEIGEDAYFSLLRCAIESGKVDAIDIEYNHCHYDIEKTLQIAKSHHIAVIMSSHDFKRTPSYDEIVNRLLDMKRLGADISKIACMPASPKDVLTLLAATEAVKSSYPDYPLITMSMGKLGAISRICGETFGSSITFGSARKASAPGQLDVTTLHKIITSLSIQ